MFRQILRRQMTTTASAAPKPRIALDPSFAVLMKDIDASLAKNHESTHSKIHEELQVVQDFASLPLDDGYDPMAVHEEERKSPAAIYGSQSIGAVVLPDELQDAISVLINDADKPRLRDDAKRLFLDEEAGNGGWNTEFDATYKSFEQRKRHAERDGTAFATVALPAHYSAILSVLTHARHRLGPTWQVDRVVDWGAATGSALWAALHTFQRDIETPLEDVKAAESTVKTYMGIDKRAGLTDIGKRILREIPIAPGADFSFRKGHPYPSLDRVPNTLAISAFSLSVQPSDQHRKQIIQEMWDSGAETIVLIDHATKPGFAAIVESREALLNRSHDAADADGDPEMPKLNRGESVHVVAPCPHEKECPLVGSKLQCRFGQRLQRPNFVRRTKHSGVGHEDTLYSYVVLRRGPRPERVSMHSEVGRVGRIGSLQAEKEARESPREVVITDGAGELEPKEEEVVSPVDHDKVAETLRLESFSWPRVVFPPMKKGGHIILDACTAEGKIIRLTVPRSQGKQPYYDARKSSWGDLFPHPPKNAPQDRYQAKRSKVDGPVLRGSDIGKGNAKGQKKHDPEKAAYEKIKKELNIKRRKERKLRKMATD
ncbi:Rsm22-domain-containing protein [Hymenopellis radicata]|nr:Rsm22-domain-containing protein [Hymenopellis radicata]